VPSLPDRRLSYAVLVLGLLATLAAIAVPLAPVTQDRVTLTWPAAGSDATAAAIPLMPYQPIELAATIPCESQPTATTVLLSTVPLRPEPGAPLLPGLRVERTDGDLVVSSYGLQVARTTQPSGACKLEIRSNPDGTAVTLNGQPISDVAGDVRPVVAGAFTEGEPRPGLRLQLVTDTRFQTTMTPVKAALGALSVLALLGALLTVARLDNRSDRTRRLPTVLPQRWWRPRAVDTMVIGGLGLWAVIGPINIDDGYIAGIVRTRETNGYVGNLHRWLNAPEAPFGWFYELYHLWSQISVAPLWMRIPSTVLGVLCWLLLSRALLPRLGAFAARPATVWVAAAVFGLWWLPFNLGLRPEPWIAVAGLITVLAVERAVVTRRLLPVLMGLVVAAAATAVTPTGIITFTPFLAGLVPLLRALRQRRPELPGLALLVLLVAAPSSALLLAFGDQTLASVAEATRIRKLVGGDLPWHREIERYSNLLAQGSVEGPLQRRMPVLLTLLGLAGIAWFLTARRAKGLARGPVARVSLTLVLSLVALTFTPTKWTYHFGALAGVGSAVLVVALYAWSHRALRGQQDQQDHGASANSLAAAAVGTAALAVTAGVALAGFNEWHYVSSYGVTWSTIAPQLGGLQASTAVLVGGLLLTAVSGGSAAWALAGGRAVSIVRSLPSPGLLALLLVIATVALQVGSVARAAIEQRSKYTLAADSAAALVGSSCGLADHLRVETDPREGLLAATGAGKLDGFLPVPNSTEMAGAALPGWVATSLGDHAQGTTPWYRLDDPEAPVVVTISGELGPGSSLVAEFGNADGTPLATVPLSDQAGAPAARDIRIAVPDREAKLVRLTATAQRGPGKVPLAFSQPRTPRTQPMNALLPPGTEAIVEWPVAFLYPCLEIAGTPEGTAALPRWRVGTPAVDPSGGIITVSQTAGPFVTPRTLVRVHQVPVYLDGDPLRDVATLYRWQPLSALGRPDVSRHSEVVGGWQRRGRLHVPGLG
jgi:arabinosyltransferase A/arabinosyltransferase B/arabinosyltransferase C